MFFSLVTMATKNAFLAEKSQFLALNWNFGCLVSVKFLGEASRTQNFVIRIAKGAQWAIITMVTMATHYYMVLRTGIWIFFRVQCVVPILFQAFNLFWGSYSRQIYLKYMLIVLNLSQINCTCMKTLNKDGLENESGASWLGRITFLMRMNRFEWGKIVTSYEKIWFACCNKKKIRLTRGFSIWKTKFRAFPSHISSLGKTHAVVYA